MVSLHVVLLKVAELINNSNSGLTILILKNEPNLSLTEFTFPISWVWSYDLLSFNATKVMHVPVCA